MSMEDIQMQDNQEVEVENLNGGKSTEEITKPFNPNEIDVDISTVNLGSLIDQLENDEIDLQPDFQRVTDVWDNVKKSRLIESILLGLPLPSFYFSEDPVSQKLSIIDGLQRICAIRDFVLEKENPLKLEGLQFLKNFDGFTFSQLARPEVKRIKSLKITMNTVRKGTPLDVKYIIFQRVNTAGVPLTPQEMRHALNQGPAAIFIKELADMESFKKATNDSVESKRMQDRDFVNRFIAFFIGYQDYMGDLDMFLNDKMGELNKMTSKQRDDIRVSFDKAMKCCYEIFKKDTFRKRYKQEDRRKPISKSVYDTLSVNIAWLSDEEQLMLLKNAEAFKTGMIRLFNDERFNFSISTGTGQKYNVDLRFTMVKSLIKEIISL
ncbi:GmrSD restriction endonuclease domain-containing protein [Phocaeicola plebeius]